MNDGRVPGETQSSDRKRGFSRTHASGKGKGPGGKGPRLPAPIFAEAKRLESENGLPRAMALQVASGKMQLKDALGLLLLQDKVERLVQSKALMIRYATPVLRGLCTLDKALFLSAVAYRKAADDYCLCHFDKYAGTDTSLVIGLVDKRTLTVSVASVSKYDVIVKTADGTEQSIPKHDVKFYFEAGSKKAVLKHLDWGGKETRTAPGALASVKARTDLPARLFMAPQLAGKAVTIVNGEGDQFRGRISWFGKYELVLELGPGTEVVVMRHSLVSIVS